MLSDLPLGGFLIAPVRSVRSRQLSSVLTREEEDFGQRRWRGAEDDPAPPGCGALTPWILQEAARSTPPLAGRPLASEQSSAHRVPELVGSRLGRSCASLLGSCGQEASSLALNEAV